jgi:hypothetical protein
LEALICGYVNERSWLFVDEPNAHLFRERREHQSMPGEISES